MMELLVRDQSAGSTWFSGQSIFLEVFSAHFLARSTHADWRHCLYKEERVILARPIPAEKPSGGLKPTGISTRLVDRNEFSG